MMYICFLPQKKASAIKPEKIYTKKTLVDYFYNFFILKKNIKQQPIFLFFLYIENKTQ